MEMWFGRSVGSGRVPTVDDRVGRRERQGQTSVRSVVRSEKRRKVDWKGPGRLSTTASNTSQEPAKGWTLTAICRGEEVIHKIQ